MDRCAFFSRRQSSSAVDGQFVQSFLDAAQLHTVDEYLHRAIHVIDGRKTRCQADVAIFRVPAIGKGRAGRRQLDAGRRCPVDDACGKTGQRIERDKIAAGGIRPSAHAAAFQAFAQSSLHALKLRS